LPATPAYSVSSDAEGGIRRLVAAIVIGGLVAGTLDIFVACAINHVGPGVILQAIASGLLGRRSFAGGADTMAVGLLLQWVMALIISAIYGVASLKLPDLYRRPSLFGALYGFPVYVVMTFVVLPLSAAHAKHFPTLLGVALNLAAMVLFGLILAFTGWAMKAARR
jgi:uncharacterized membrane protein YagU involved in acid resistance